MAEPTRRRGRPRSASEASGTIQALDRALDILDLLAANPGLTLSEVAEEMGQSPSTVHRVLHTLAARRVAESDPATQTWHIGPATFRLGAAFMRRSGLGERARPFLRTLMEHTGETANLGIPEENSVLSLAQVETHESIRACFAPGTRLPLHASAMGKVLLTFGRPERLQQLIDTTGLARCTDKTLITRDALLEDMQRIRTRGFAFDDEERTRGMRCIAAPVLDHDGKLVAAISISGPTQRIGHEHVKTLGAVVVATAGDLTQALGG
ncbi:HTH-type transcriptional regulator BhcR [Paracoccus seriniphilus]|uniref:Transcriptional regulator, IclR family n=1 Tax=Paracoccus seriniphilus TaxID=184748 RepID=A0A239PVS7_9RHOB|nr:HTH-type transcriptional regulator BhcR [Paracoccus seriniphilus]WCR13357.1 IclR family transcriptional regulator [Paracoccus seriniphilus]SNT74399.1 transcriptional regulator, IclR family [Paracoccus seriniphilus]